MTSFYFLFLGKEELCITGQDAIAAIKIVQACEKAAKTKTIIDLQW